MAQGPMSNVPKLGPSKPLITRQEIRVKVEIKLFASLRRLLPPSDEGHPTYLDLADGMTVAGLLDQLRISREMAYLILVNGVNIEGEHSRTLQEGDTVCVFPSVAG